MKIMNFLNTQFLKIIPLGGFRCCYCEKNSLSFLKYAGGMKNQPSLIKELKIIGSNLDSFSCPKCQSHDRERHLKLYFESLNLSIHVKNKTILHFAPEQHFSKYIENLNPNEYIKADIYTLHKMILKK